MQSMHAVLDRLHANLLRSSVPHAPVPATVAALGLPVVQLAAAAQQPTPVQQAATRRVLPAPPQVQQPPQHRCYTK